MTFWQKIIAWLKRKPRKKGIMYNWYAVMGIHDAASASNASLRKKLAPVSWHIPSDSEWSLVVNFLDPAADGGNLSNTAGGKMKTIGTVEAGTGLWFSPNTSATNLTGFSGVPGGSRDASSAYSSIGSIGFWWSSSESDLDNAWSRSLYGVSARVARSSGMKYTGYSVRCIKD